MKRTGDCKGALIRIQRDQAEGAATNISEFIQGIESQVGWTTQLPWSASTIDQRRFGKKRLPVSRLEMDEPEPGTDYSRIRNSPRAQVYYGPVYFRRESEPYMTLSLAGTRRESCSHLSA